MITPVTVEKVVRKVHNRIHSTRLAITTGLPVHNHALARSEDFRMSAWFPTGRCYVGTLTTRAFNQTPADQDLSGLFLNLYLSGVG